MIRIRRGGEKMAVNQTSTGNLQIFVTGIYVYCRWGPLVRSQDGLAEPFSAVRSD